MKAVGQQMLPDKNKKYNILKTLIKCVIMLFPKILREQYNDTWHYYVNILSYLFGPKDHFKSVTLISEPQTLDNLEILNTEQNRTTRIVGPILFNSSLSATHLPSIYGQQPNLELLKISNVQAIGGTLGLHKNKFFFHPELAISNNLYDNKQQTVYIYESDYNSVFNVKIKIHKKQRQKIKVGLHLLKEHSHNYYHWMFECMPRLIYFMQQNKHHPTEITLLIDHDVPKQSIEMLSHYMQQHEANYTILLIKKGEFVVCDKLYYVTPFWYSLDNTRHLPNVHKDFLVDQNAISLIRNAFKTIHPSNNKKIYLTRRNSSIRNIINQDEIESMMANLGFQIIETNSMSFLEQRELFSETSIVVGAAGACFANTIFMPQNTTAIIISPDNILVNYYIFQQIADVANLNLVHFLGQKSTSKYVHDDFIVDCNQLKKIIRMICC